MDYFDIGGTGMKLLLAEDEVDMSEALVDILTYHKYTVDAVFDGEEALDYATIGEYDGIILDIMMLKMKKMTNVQISLTRRSARTWRWRHDISLCGSTWMGRSSIRM